MLTGSPLHDHHYTLAVRRRLHAHSLAVNQPVVAEGVAGLQIVRFLAGRTHGVVKRGPAPVQAPPRTQGPGRTYGAVRLLVPLDQKAGAVPHDHPLQMRRHGGSCGKGAREGVKGAAGRAAPRTTGRGSGVTR